MRRRTFYRIVTRKYGTKIGYKVAVNPWKAIEKFLAEDARGYKFHDLHAIPGP